MKEAGKMTTRAFGLGNNRCAVCDLHDQSLDGKAGKDGNQVHSYILYCDNDNTACRFLGQRYGKATSYHQSSANLYAH